MLRPGLPNLVESAAMVESQTPMMRQYREAKAQVPGALLLFRMGDFYELFFDDAEEAARLLGLTLTSRDKGENPIPMAGFPYHSIEMYLRRLMEAGRTVAICEQVENPKEAQGLVRREITRVVTPGTLTDESLLDPRRANHLVAIAAIRRPRAAQKTFGLAWVDLSRGTITVADVPEGALVEEISRLEPAECLLSDAESPRPEWWMGIRPPAVTPRPAWHFSPSNAQSVVQEHFRVRTFGGFGVDDDSAAIPAAGALLLYLRETQKTSLAHVARLVAYRREEGMVLDPVTRRSLEISRTLREQRSEGSLLGAIDRTVTAAGARALAEWLERPLVDVESIRQRQSAIAEWKDDPAGRRELRDLLKGTYDVERLAARISTGRTHPRDLASLRSTLRQLPAIKARLAGRNALRNAELDTGLVLFADLRARLERFLVDDPPMQLRDGGIVRNGFHPELDELRGLARGGKEWIAAFQKQEAERSGIANLKVGFNKVFGYYLEVNHSARDKVPCEWQRKQTIKNAERYITPQLKEYEQKVLTAEERARQLEFELFRELREEVAERTTALQGIAAVLAELDTLSSLAELAQERGYIRPSVIDAPQTIIEGGRHPVLDATLSAGRFVPNDTTLAPGEGTFLLLTGPNMAGKSTYIRQVALLTLLAQIGSFLPVQSATIGIADRLFARVGASDELGRGHSTFMVEMIETAAILNNATPKSLVILDEIGRGTSTYDGVSLAWAIAEHLHDQVGCRTLFATHYHELIELERSLANLRNGNAAVREWKDEVVFLHQIVPGGADRSYGIHVAKLAGLPKRVLERARYILEQLERDPFGQNAAGRIAEPTKHRRAYHQLSLFPVTSAHPVLDELRGVEVDSLAPAAAVEWIRALKERLLATDS